MRVLNTFNGLRMMTSSTNIFKPEEHFKNKRVAVIGAADSAFAEEKGDYINDFDYVIRINKAPHSLTSEKAKFVGNRTDVLFHSFYENTESGGGPIDFDLYAKQGVKFLVNPNSDMEGLKTHLVYYKRNLNDQPTYLLPIGFYSKLRKNFGKWVPTVGYSALYTAMNSGAKEVYVTGFTFFKTPYADDYRDHVKDMEKNNKFIEKQGLHNPDLELMEFIRQKKETESRVVMDKALESIVNSFEKIPPKK